MSWTRPKCDRELPLHITGISASASAWTVLFEGRSLELILVFDKILAVVSDWPKVLIGVTPN